jgi:hypothetical protein
VHSDRPTISRQREREDQSALDRAQLQAYAAAVRDTSASSQALDLLPELEGAAGATRAELVPA